MSIVSKFNSHMEETFEQSTEELAQRVLTSVFLSIERELARGLKTSDTAKVVVPWGTFTADYRTRNGGDSANTNVMYEPSEAFIEALNEGNVSRGHTFQDFDEFSPSLLSDFADYLAYGFFDPFDENKDRLETANKAFMPTDHQKAHFFNAIPRLFVDIANEKTTNGKSYRLDLMDEIQVHGFYDFDLDDDKFSVRFTPSKTFKQFLKDDEAAADAV